MSLFGVGRPVPGPDAVGLRACVELRGEDVALRDARRVPVPLAPQRAEKARVVGRNHVHLRSQVFTKLSNQSTSVSVFILVSNNHILVLHADSSPHQLVLVRCMLQQLAS